MEWCAKLNDFSCVTMGSKCYPGYQADFSNQVSPARSKWSVTFCFLKFNAHLRVPTSDKIGTWHMVKDYLMVVYSMGTYNYSRGLIVHWVWI